MADPARPVGARALLERLMGLRPDLQGVHQAELDGLMIRLLDGIRASDPWLCDDSIQRPVLLVYSTGICPAVTFTNAPSCLCRNA
jgi:hypothetical protein